jgi:hypothetical protein
MTIKDIFETEEIDMLLEAITAQERKCAGIAKQPIKGDRVGEREKKQEWADKAEEWRLLETKIAYMLD